MIKKFEEFVNEGLISDYKKQEEAKNKEVSEGEKTFILDVLKRFDEIDLPFVFTCKNCAIISDSVATDKVPDFREKTFRFKDLKEDGSKDIHISNRSLLRVLDKDSEWLEKDVQYKNIWESIYKWFEKNLEKDEISFNDGKIRADELIERKNDIKKELF